MILRILLYILVFGLLGAIIATAILGVRVIAHLSPEVVGAAVTALVGLAGILYAQWYSKKKEISESHRPAKIKVYDTYFEIVELFLNDAKSDVSSLDDGELPKELVDQFTKMSRGFIQWASPDVILAWNRFRDLSNKKGEKEETLFLVDDVLQAIRKDLGNSNYGLKRGDVVKMYLSHPAEVDELHK